MMNEFRVDILENSLDSSSPVSSEYLSSDHFPLEMGETSDSSDYLNGIEYLSRSYIEMPQTGEVNFISTIMGVTGNPIYKGQGVWSKKIDKSTSTTIKVDKDDIRAKRHYVKTLVKDGREIKIWECGLCGKEFKFQYTLVRHIPTHTDVRNYQCDICPKAFRQLSTLAQHKATHWNMRAFSCEFCNKSFNRISTLVSHKKIHYDEKKHVCDYCGKGFHQKGNLKNHMYTHTDERPYKCEICGKGFNQKSNLVCHKMSTHSRKDNYICEMCNITFGKQTLYSCHMESIHGIIQNQTKTQRVMQLTSNQNKHPTHCSVVDESNNVIFSLPLSSEKRRRMENYDTLNNTQPAYRQPTFSGDEILAVIGHESINSVLSSLSKNQIPFVLYYPNGEIQPKICKIQFKENYYTLTNPTTEDIMKYCAKDNNANKKTAKLSIIATIFQKKDSQGEYQYLIVPAGLKSQIQQQDVNEQEKAAIIYTKLQPNIRHLKESKDFLVNKSLKSNKALLHDRFLNISKPTNLRQENEMKSALVCVFVPPTKIKEEDNKFMSIDSQYKTDTLISHNRLAMSKINIDKFYENSKMNCDMPNEKNDSLDAPEDKVLIASVKPFKIAKTNSDSLLKEINSIKKENGSENFLSSEVDENFNDSTDHPLFINPDNLREPLSKYNLDLDDNDLDILNAYNFTDSFLASEVNSAMSEAPNAVYDLSQPDYSNPSSPSSYSFHL